MILRNGKKYNVIIDNEIIDNGIIDNEIIYNEIEKMTLYRWFIGLLRSIF